jgi:drug/metabolite transporter (DMT)-like permease
MNTRRTHLDWLAISLLLLCCLFWGWQQVLVKATLPEVPAVSQAALRFMGSALTLWIWCRIRKIPLWQADGSLPAGLLAGVLFSAEFVCMYLGLKYTSASRLTIFLYTAPFWVALLLPLWLKTERMRPLQWLGLGVAFAASAFALRDGMVQSLGRDMAWLGDLLAVGAGAFWGLTTVVIRSSRLASLSPEKVLFYQVAISAVVLPWVAWGLGEQPTLDISRFAWLSLFLQTFVGAFASYLTWMWMLSHYPATKISVFVFLTPIFALLFGTLWLGETLTPGLIAALTGVAVGIVLVNRK